MPNSSPRLSAARQVVFLGSWQTKLVFLVCALLIATVWLFTLNKINSQREQAIADQLETNAVLARAQEGRVANALQIFDQILLVLRDDFLAHGKPPSLNQRLKAMHVDRTYVGIVSLIDEAGEVIATTAEGMKINFSDREYFKEHASDRTDRLLIGKPIVGRKTGKSIISLTRRLYRPDGSFAGVVFLALDPDFLAPSYSKDEMAKDATITLVGTDGIVRVRQINGINSSGEDVRAGKILSEVSNADSGHFVSVTPIDGRQRATSYRKLPDYPLVVLVGSPVEQVTEALKGSERTHLLSASLGTLILLTFATAISRAMARSRHQIEKASATANRMRAIIDASPVPMALNDSTGHITFLNRSFVEVLGYALEDIPTIEVWWANAYPDPSYRAWVIKTWGEEVERTVKTGAQFVPMEVNLRCKNGTEKVAFASAARYSPDKDAEHLVVLFDITERKQAEAAHQASEARWKFAIEGAGDGLWDWNIHTGEAFYSPRYKQMYGYAETDFGTTANEWSDRIHPDDAPGVYAALQPYMEGQPGSAEVEFRMLCKDGSWKWSMGRGMVVERDGDGKPLRMIGINTDISQRKTAQEKLQLAASVFTHALEGIVITTSDGSVVDVNDAFTHITGYNREAALGQNPRFLSSGRHDRNFYAVMWGALTQQGRWSGEIWNRRKNGDVYPEWLSISAVKDGAGVTTHYVGIFNDISERKADQEQIEKLAFFDPLTRLPNRRLLLDRLEQALHTGTRHKRKSALLFVDLDNFKTLNDTLGHHQGDLMLAQVAQRLKGCVRDGDTVARLGSDEFVVLVEDLSENMQEAANQAETVGEKILTALAQDYTLVSGTHHSTTSIGVTLFSGEQQDGNDEPLKRAELAMFQAKAVGRNAMRFYDAQMQAEVSAHASLEADLHQGLAGQQFSLHYQPQVVGMGHVTGVEALLRWQHPQRGMVSPAQFIPLAEETGLILQIGQWVLETACAQLAAWATNPVLRELTVAVNVSARQFEQADFVDSVLATLARTGAPPKLLKLELTESMLVDKVEDVISKMGVLKAHGVCFSLDDFGTGYSSLAYLKRLPLDQLKIDQGFVRNIVTDSNDAAIAKMVVALAESLGLSVIAEGVEMQAQADFLAHLGCHAYQGYLFSKPLSVEAFELFLQRR